MIALGLSTSTPQGSVALVETGGAVLAEVSYAELVLHAERLFATVDEALARAGVARPQIGLVACDVGPGSFTGIRVGVAAAAGIAMGLGIPAVGVSSLRAMAEPVLAEGAACPVVALLDAQKSEVFMATFDAQGELLIPAEHRAQAALAERLSERSAAGQLLCGAVLEALGLGHLAHPAPGARLPSAAWIARLALRGSAGPLDPVYVRPPDAKPAMSPGPSA